MTTLRRIGTSVVTAVGITLAASGCAVVTGSAAGPSASAVPAVVPSGSAAPLPVLVASTPPPRSPAPALKQTGTAWPAILASLTGYGQWALANPNPALARTIAEPGCAMYNLVYDQANGLLRDKTYLQPAAATFGTVVGPSPAPGSPAGALGNKVVLAVTVSRPAEPVLSRSGAVRIGAFDQLPPTALQITLLKGADGRWRFCTVDAESDSGADDDPSVPLL
ncbi:hypothetical protein [Actinoplanes sp. NPDC049681]|uniref:hypothetical protein n=1 Tax=Actinoplanes sp. NPDC049681 TaxID=3363905 RepID=UPI00378BED9B